MFCTAYYKYVLNNREYVENFYLMLTLNTKKAHFKSMLFFLLALINLKLFSAYLLKKFLYKLK